MKTTAGAVLWGLTGAGVCAAMARLDPSLIEEGIALHIAERLVDGERLFRDVASFTGPVPFELLALLFRIFGEEIAVARAVMVLLHGAASAATFAITRRGGAGALAHAAGACMATAPVYLFSLLSIYFYTSLTLPLCVLTAWAALRGLDSPRWAVAAGVGVACIALSKQTVGAVLAPALLLAVVLAAAPERRARAALEVASGGAVVAVLTLGFYAARGDLDALFYSLVTMPLSFHSGFGSPMMNFWPPGVLAGEIAAQWGDYLPVVYVHLRRGSGPPGTAMVLLTQFLYALPFLALAATLALRLARPIPAAAWLQGAALVAVTSGLSPRADWGHLALALPLAVSQLLLLAGVLLCAERPRHWLAWSAAGLAGALLIGASVVGGRLYAVAAPPRLGPRVPLPRVMLLNRSPALPRVVNYLRSRVEPGEAIFVARGEALLYWATETRNPTPYSGVIPGLREEQEAAILPALEDVRFVVMSDIDTPLYNIYRDELPAVQAYLERHFQIPAFFTGKNATRISVLERGKDRGPTAIDLFERAPEADAWVRGPGGAEKPAAPGPRNVATRQNRRPLPVRLGAGGGGIDFEIEVPREAVFEADIGMARVVWVTRRMQHPQGGRFVVSVEHDGVREEILDVRPTWRQRWTPVEVDLSPWGGERVTLRLEFRGDRRLRPGALAWWGSPRIAVPAEPEG